MIRRSSQGPDGAVIGRPGGEGAMRSPEPGSRGRAQKNGSLCRAMLDHIFIQLVTSLKESFESALLQRQAVEERFQVDVFLGDVSFETSYSLPGEQRPARIRVDTSLDWPTWSQTAYRSWAIGDDLDEPPEVLVEIAFRVQGLVGVPDAGPLLSVLPAHLDVLGEPLTRGPATIEQMLLEAYDDPECAIEVAYEGSCAIDESILDEPATLDAALAPVGRDVASLLVRIGDLPFAFRPAEEADD